MEPALWKLKNFPQLKISKVIQSERMPRHEEGLQGNNCPWKIYVLQARRICWQSSGALHQSGVKKIGNMMSRDMLLAADGPDGRQIFLTITEGIPPGTSIH